MPIPTDSEIRETLARRDLALVVDPEDWEAEHDRLFPLAAPKARAIALSAYRLLHTRGAWSLPEQKLADAARARKSHTRRTMIRLEAAGLLHVHRPDVCRLTAEGPRNLPNTVWLGNAGAPLPPRLVTTAAIFRLLTGLGHAPQWVARALKAGRARAVDLRGVIAVALARMRAGLRRPGTLGRFVFAGLRSAPARELAPSGGRDSRPGSLRQTPRTWDGGSGGKGWKTPPVGDKPPPQERSRHGRRPDRREMAPQPPQPPADRGGPEPIGGILARGWEG